MISFVVLYIVVQCIYTNKLFIREENVLQDFCGFVPAIVVVQQKLSSLTHALMFTLHEGE